MTAQELIERLQEIQKLDSPVALHVSSFDIETGKGVLAVGEITGVHYDISQDRYLIEGDWINEIDSPE